MVSPKRVSFHFGNQVVIHWFSKIFEKKLRAESHLLFFTHLPSDFWIVANGFNPRMSDAKVWTRALRTFFSTVALSDALSVSLSLCKPIFVQLTLIESAFHLDVGKAQPEMQIVQVSLANSFLKSFHVIII